MIGIRLYDRMDKELPNAGLIQLMDAETDATQWVDSGNAYVRRKYEEAFFQRTAYCAEVFKKANSDLLHLKTGDDYINVLRRFFKSRVKGGIK